MKHESDSDSYEGDVEDISVDESGGDTFMSDIEITDSDSDCSVVIQVLQ
jgi:hypothetical protein